MPCHLKVYDPDAATTVQYVCDEDTTSRVVEDDHAAASSAEYTDLDGKSFTVDWTRQRLVGFLRQADDGRVIASGGADGSQTKIS